MRVAGNQNLWGHTGAASCNLSLPDRPKLPLLILSTKVPAGSAEAAGVPDGSGRLGPLGCPRSQALGPQLYSNVLPLLDRLLKPKVGTRLPSMHYCEVCGANCAGPQTYWTTWKDRSTIRGRQLRWQARRPAEVQEGLEPSLLPVCCVLYLCCSCEGPKGLQITHQIKETPLGPRPHHVLDLYRWKPDREGELKMGFHPNHWQKWISW